MITIKATVRDGRIELDEPLDLPDGTELTIPVPDGAEWRNEPMSAVEIERVLAARDGMTSLAMTDAELADWEADRLARREREKSQFSERYDKLSRAWE